MDIVLGILKIFPSSVNSYTFQGQKTGSVDHLFVFTYESYIYIYILQFIIFTYQGDTGVPTAPQQIGTRYCFVRAPLQVDQQKFKYNGV